MSIQTAIPYLTLNGRARQAITLYERALGASVETLSRFGDVDQSCPEAMKDNVMHAELRLGDAVLMLSDGPGQGDLPPTGIVSVALNMNDTDEARQAFDALAEGGAVVQALVDAPWGALFGMIHDRFGVCWMFNCATSQD